MTDRDSETSPEQENVLPIDEHEEIVSEGGKKVRRRGIYLLPNLLTLSALFAGFYAIIAGMSGDFNEAGWAILIAGICDGLDGRIARLTNTQSEFGAQFDSLSDMVSFGVAPSLIMFSWGFGPLDRVGWAASFVFVSCAAIRLARFNVQLGTADKRFFVGLQSPLAAGVVTFIPWVAHKYGVEVTPLIAYLAAILTVFTGLLMISNYKYFSFKELNFKGTVPLMVFVFAVVFLVVVAQNPHEVLLLGAILYGSSGPIWWLYKNRFAKSVSTASPQKEAKADIKKGTGTEGNAETGTEEGAEIAKPAQNQVKPVKRTTKSATKADSKSGTKTDSKSSAKSSIDSSAANSAANSTTSSTPKKTTKSKPKANASKAVEDSETIEPESSEKEPADKG